MKYGRNAKVNLFLAKNISRFLIGAVMSMVVSACAALEVSVTGLDERPDLRPFEKPLPINTKPKRMVIGNRFVVAVKENGTVWSWGTGSHGELGTGPDDTRHYEPRQLPELSEVIEVAAGFNHVIALKKDGTVWGWGGNKHSQLGGDKSKRVSLPERISGVANIKRIAATANGSAFLKDSGELLGLGDNSEGSFIEAQKKIIEFPVVIKKETNAASIFAGVVNVGVIRRDGFIENFGTSYFTDKEADLSVLKASDADIRTFGVVLTTDGFVYIGNSSDSEALGQGEAVRKGGFMRVKGLGRVIKVSYRGGSVNALDESGRLWQWGTNVMSFPDPGGAGVSRVYTPAVFFKLDGIVDVFSGPLSNAVFTENGDVYFWGSGEGGERTRKMDSRRLSKEEWMTPEKVKWAWK